MSKKKKGNKSKQRKINKNKPTNNAEKTISYNNKYKSKFNYRMLFIILLCIITILQLTLCIHFDIINLNPNSIFDIPLKKMLHNFFNNDYIVNILCTIITAITLYILQIRYSKCKIKRDFRCNEIISDLYYGIEIANELHTKAECIRNEINLLNDVEFQDKEKIKNQKFIDFYIDNKSKFHMCNLSLTYHNNDILIESIQTVFFINLNFKLLNIINNIKNRKPNLAEEYPKIEALYDKFKKGNREADSFALSWEIEHYITDIGFMGVYCLELLNYLGYDPIPSKLYSSIFNQFYPNMQDRVEFEKLPLTEQNKIGKKITRIAHKKYLKYKTEKFFR